MNTKSRKDVQAENRKWLLGLLRGYGSTDIGRLTEITSLSKLTVSKIVKYWCDKGIIIPAGKGNTVGESVGKKPTLYAINNHYKLFFVSQLYETSLLSAVTNLDASVILSERVSYEKDTPLNEILKFARDHYDKMSAQLKLNDSRFAAVVLGTSGITDSKEGVIVFSPHFKSWGYHVPVLGMLREIFPKGFNLYVDNWVRYQAYAELKIGSARQVKRFVEIGTEPDGVTSGLVWDGDLISGKRGLAGEIGHMPVALDSDVVCACGGIGCLEPAISLLRMQERARTSYAECPDSLLYQNKDAQAITYKDVFATADAGDEHARHLLDGPARYFAAAISHVVQVCDPELIIIQGEYAHAGEYFIEQLRTLTRKTTLPTMDKNIRIQYSSLNDKQGLIGAAFFAADRFFEGLS